MSRLLIVEDDAAIAMALRMAFEHERHIVRIAADGHVGLLAVSDFHPDLIVLDVTLPKVDGLEFCRRLRATRNRVPVIFLTARSDELDKVVGLRAGGDDYVTKPFSLIELIARTEAVLRRVGKHRPSVDNIAFGEVQIDFRKHVATRAGVIVEMTAREFSILQYLAQREGEVVSRDDLLEAVWGYEEAPLTRTVDVHISKLRAKVEPDPARPAHLLTIHGTGYRFER